MPLMGWAADEDVVSGLDTLPRPPEPVAALPRVVERLAVARVTGELAAVEPVDAAGVELAAGSGEAEAGVATGFTSTVLFAAALLRVVRRRGEGDGVAMGLTVWKRNGNGGERGKLPIRPDSSDQ